MIKEAIQIFKCSDKFNREYEWKLSKSMILLILTDSKEKNEQENNSEKNKEIKLTHWGIRTDNAIDNTLGTAVFPPPADGYKLQTRSKWQLKILRNTSENEQHYSTKDVQNKNV